MQFYSSESRINISAFQSLLRNRNLYRKRKNNCWLTFDINSCSNLSASQFCASINSAIKASCISLSVASAFWSLLILWRHSSLLIRTPSERILSCSFCLSEIIQNIQSCNVNMLYTIQPAMFSHQLILKLDVKSCLKMYFLWQILHIKVNIPMGVDSCFDLSRESWSFLCCCDIIRTSCCRFLSTDISTRSLNWSCSLWCLNSSNSITAF